MMYAVNMYAAVYVAIGVCVWCVWCGVLVCVVCGVCVCVCGVCVVCVWYVWCVCGVCGVWCVVCGVWCVGVCVHTCHACGVIGLLRNKAFQKFQITEQTGADVNKIDSKSVAFIPAFCTFHLWVCECIHSPYS